MRVALERILKPSPLPSPFQGEGDFPLLFEGLKRFLLVLPLLFRMMVFPTEGRAELTAQEMIALAQQQLTVPSELVLGEMKVYRWERLNRFYSFVLAKLWDAETRTEYVRTDFKTPVDSADSRSYSDQRYLLKREPQTPATQWLYLPALRRVRTVPYQADDPVLQSDHLFYDLTPIQSFNDYRYRFVDPG